ncbi:MAG: DUF4838 domain-containing protein, partial [Planctomycetales bacterium]
RGDWEEWNLHNRMGGKMEIRIGHTWHGLKPDVDFEKHPEWFALVKGKRQPTKPCYRHPETLKRAIQFTLEAAKKTERGMISMTPPDGLGYCECQRCREVFQGAKPYPAHGSLFARRGDGTVVNITSETLFAFVNQVADAAAKQSSDAMIGCYAYSAYSHPPSFKLRPNVYLQTTAAYRRTPLTMEEQIRAFGEKTEQVGVREYYSVFQWDWDYPSQGKLDPHQLQEQLRFYHREGITAVNAEASNNWAARGLGYYIASRLLWDVDADLDAILQDFYDQAFGPAAKPMRRYYERWHGENPAALRVKNGHDEAVLKAMFRDLDEAASLTENAPDCRERVDHLRMYWHYLFLRRRLELAEKNGDEQTILQAIQAETVFGGRLTYANLVHSRALIGKAFPRRFRKHAALLEKTPDAQSGGPWRKIGEPPSREELDRLWRRDKIELGLK